MRLMYCVCIAFLLAPIAGAQEWKPVDDVDHVTGVKTQAFTIAGHAPEGSKPTAAIILACRDGKLQTASVTFDRMVREGLVQRNFDGDVGSTVWAKAGGSGPRTLFMAAKDAGRILHSRQVRIGVADYSSGAQIAVVFDIPSDYSQVSAACGKTKNLK
jgi:hypothetical protein